MGDTYSSKFDPALSGLTVRQVLARARSFHLRAKQMLRAGHGHHCIAPYAATAAAYALEAEERWLAFDLPPVAILRDGSIAAPGIDSAWQRFIGGPRE